MITRSSLLVLFVTLSVLLGFIICVIETNTSQNTYTRGAITLVKTLDGELISTTDDTVNVDGTNDNFVSSARNVTAASVPFWQTLKNLIIPASLPNTAGECGESSSISCE